MSLVGQTGSSTVPVDIWVGEDGLVRRLTQRLRLNVQGGPSAIEQRFELYDFGAKVEVVVPDADDVADLTDLLDVRGATAEP